jgi:parallel beta-helix repeat protein
MKKGAGILFLAGLLVCLLSTAVIGPAQAQAVEEDARPPGALEGTGTYFELPPGDYLGVVVATSEPVCLALQSFPQLVMMQIRSAWGATSAEVWIGGLAPCTTYYKYEDDYDHETIFTTDVNGAYVYTQDLSQRHLIIIQTNHGTKHIRDDATGGDAASIGIWDEATKTCVLTRNLSEGIEIDSDGITLDGDGHSIIFPPAGYGVYADSKTGLTIKNLNISGMHVGIFLDSCTNSTITNNSISSTFDGIELYFGSNNTVTGNTSSSNNFYGIYGYAQANTTITDNILTSNNFSGVNLGACQYCVVADNVISYTTSFGGIQVGGGRRILIENNTCSNNRTGIRTDYGNDYVIRGNTVSGSTYYGIMCYYGGYYGGTEEVYNNNFINNVYQVFAYGDTVFNIDLPHGGNYWSNWTSPDNNHDGFVDFPYGRDQLPWTLPNAWPPPPEIPSNTLPGLNVTVDLGSGVTITFAEVTTAGDTMAITSSSAPHGPPTGFWFLGTYYDLSTTAGYVGPITISIPYSPSSIPGNRESKLRIFHWDGSGWQDATLSVDTVNHVITGQISSLSWFAVGWPTYTWLGFLPPIADADKAFKQGSTIPIKFRISEDGLPLTNAVATWDISLRGLGAPSGEPEVASTEAGDVGNQFRYSAEDDLYIFNLSTKGTSFRAPYTYTARVVLDDGSVWSVRFSLK